MARELGKTGAGKDIMVGSNSTDAVEQVNVFTFAPSDGAGSFEWRL